MLISDFIGEIIGLGDAQFAIAIALSQLGEHGASNAVLRFMGTYTNNETPEESHRLLQERIVLEEKLKVERGGMVSSLLEFLCQPGAIEVLVNHAHRTKECYSLGEMLVTCSIRQVYEKTMLILSRYRVNDLIVLYMDTEEYWGYFSGDVRKRVSKSADSVRRNDLSDQIVSELLADFKEWIWRNSTNGAYHTSSCAPAAFLRNAFSTMYSVNENTNYYRILNKSGVNSDVGDGSAKASVSTFIGLEGAKKDDAFDFIDVANKINRASRLLFGHNGGKIAFYDIFSCYRDGQLSNRLNKCRRELERGLPGCTFMMEDSANDLGVGHIGAVKNKKSGRISLCRVFEPMIENGLDQSELYALYDRALACTETLTVKDGVRLFSTPTQATKHYESNSEMMQIIVSGYLAVIDLLSYLEKGETSATMYNFPTVIFRDGRYLRRFHTMQEYIKYVKEVSELVNEVAADPKRSVAVADGFVQNDEIWNYLGSSNMTNDTVFQRIYNLPIGYIANAVMASKVAGKDERLLQSLKDAYGQYILVADVRGKYSVAFKTYLELFRAVNQLGVWMVSKDFQGYEPWKQYALVIAYCIQLKRIMEAERNPVVDAQGSYLLKEQWFLDEAKKLFIVHKKSIENNPKQLEVVKNACLLRVKSIAVAYRLLSGVAVEGNNCSCEQVREVFATASLLDSMVNTFKDSLENCSHNDKRQLYLLLARIAERPEVFRMPSVVSSCSDFAFIKGIEPYTISEGYSVHEILEINNRRNEFFVLAVNRFIRQVCPQQEDFQIAFELIDKYVSKRHSPVIMETVTDKVLREASCTLSTLQISEVDTNVRLCLEGILEFDSEDYALCNRERFLIQEQYVLRCGYFVKVDYINKAYSYRAVTIEDIAQIRALLLAMRRR